MKKALLTFSLLLYGIASFCQQWENTGTANLQRMIVGNDTLYRNNMGTKGFAYWYTKYQLNNFLPTGLKGQVLKVASDNSRTYVAAEPLVYGNFIYTDAQLAIAESRGQATQLQIFKSFFRFSHGGSQTNPDQGQQNNFVPGQPSQTNSWAYDTVASRVTSTFNSGSAIGLVSADKFDRYIHNVTIGSSAADNDHVGIVIAFVQGPDSVANNAYGLNPASFNWPIDVTHPKILNQHVLSLYRTRNGALLSWFVVYDFQKLTQKIIADGTGQSGLYNPNANWSGVTTDISVVRTGDTIVVKTSQFSDAPGGKGSLAFPLTINLNSDPVLAKFKGKQPYGYTSQSQAGSFFGNISFSGNNNSIYDLRNGNTYDFYNGTYTLNTAKNMYTDLGNRFYWRDTTQHTYGYIPPTNTYDVIVSPAAHTNLYGSASLNFPSTASGSQSTLTISVPGALIGSPVSVGVPTSIVTGNYQFNGYVGTAGVVSITYQNLSGSTVDPNIGLFKVTVFQ